MSTVQGRGMEGRDEAACVVSGRMRSRWVQRGQAVSDSDGRRHHLRAAAATVKMATTRKTDTMEMEKTHTDGSVICASSLDLDLLSG